MKIKYTLFAVLFAAASASAQVPEEALRLSWLTQTGTARNQAIGGAMGSLGGDATANLVNPAGLAFFKTSDFLLSPAVQMGKMKTDFRGTASSNASLNKFALGTSGLVIGGQGYRGKNSFAITITQKASFNRSFQYKGQNDYSSFAEPLGNEFSNSRLTIDQALNNPNVSLTTKMALYTYLVDTATINGSKQVIVRSETPSLLNQSYSSSMKGGITEITLGIGHELDRKWMLGGSLGIPIVMLDRDTYFRESDATGNLNNNFNYLAYREKYKMTGIGLNLRAGMIYRPKEYVRIGLAIHSPDILNIKETFQSGFAADLEKLFGQSSGYDSVSSETVNNGPVPDSRYSLTTPTKVILSGSYVFREVSNVKRQRAFISADIEYLNYKWSRFSDVNQQTDESKAYYKPFNDAVKASYKGAFNFRLGGEVKFNIVMARLGFAYYGSPYKDNALSSPRMNLSGGLGYRDKGIFVDLTYTYRMNKDVHFPYRLEAPRSNTFATLKDNGGQIMLTFGCKI
jgi:long-subunit fatty acid transport protein